MRHSVLLRSRVFVSSPLVAAASSTSGVLLAGGLTSSSNTVSSIASGRKGMFSSTHPLLAPKKKKNPVKEWGDGEDEISDEDMADFYDPEKTAEDFFGADVTEGTEAASKTPTSTTTTKKRSRVRVVSELSGDRPTIKGTPVAVDPSNLVYNEPPEQHDKTIAGQPGTTGGPALGDPAQVGTNPEASDYNSYGGTEDTSPSHAGLGASSPSANTAGAFEAAPYEPAEIDDESSLAEPDFAEQQEVIQKASGMRPKRAEQPPQPSEVPIDPLLANEAGEAAGDGEAQFTEEVIEVVQSAIDPYYAEIPMEQLVDAVVAYLRTCENPKLVDEEEEGQVFPALLSRIDDCPIPLLLDVVECNWRRSTMDRYGTVLKDLVRDRILQDAEELTPELLLRSIIVMGISAGRRKRDLDFFKTLGKLFVTNINSYKDPNDLVRVMTAFNRAKIVPPNSFLALMGRRFPVLNKRHPLRALPAYRVFSNLYRMGHDQMNPFRYLADRMFETITANLKKEKIRLKKLERAEKAGDTEKIEATKKEIERERVDAMQKLAAETKEEDYQKGAAEALAEEQWGGSEHGAQAVRRRFLELSEVRPIHLTKMLIVLARFGAPHQQYFRPLLAPLIIPSIPHFPPPSLSRIIRAIRLFKTTDEIIYKAVIDQLIALGPKQAVMSDVLEVLRALAHIEAPVPSNTEAFMMLCYEIFTDEARLRARDMCLVSSDLLLFSKKEDVTIPALDTMMKLVEVFAKRMTYLMDIGVLSLTHAEILEDISRQLKHKDESGAIAAMREKRREVNKIGDDEYYMMIDIDVRETYFKIQLVDNFNTYGPWRPVPGLLQVDFKQALTNVRVDFVLEAVHLYEQSYPEQLRITVKRLLSKAILMKMSDEGEDVIVNGEIVVRPNAPVGFAAPTVRKFANMLKVTPLKRVRRSPITWKFLLEKAVAVNDQEVIELCKQSLAFLEEAKKAGTPQSSLEKETSNEHEGEEVFIPTRGEFDKVIAAI